MRVLDLCCVVSLLVLQTYGSLPYPPSPGHLARADGSQRLSTSLPCVAAGWWQEEGFDPIFFLTVVHGGSSFADLQRGQENLEAAMGTQVG